MSSKLATAWGLVIDRSASMEEPISQTDLFTTRMDAMKTALINNLFLLILSRRDSMFKTEWYRFIVKFSPTKPYLEDKDLENMIPTYSIYFG